MESASHFQIGMAWACALIPAKLGSFERLCIAMARRARGGGQTMRFVFEGAPAPRVADLLLEAGASWSIVPGLTSLGPVAARKLRQQLSDMQPAVTHLHYCSPAGLGYPWLGEACGRLALTFHISGEPARRNRWRSLVKPVRHALTTRRLAALTAVSATSRRKLASDYYVSEAQIELIYNGVELGDEPVEPAAALGPRMIVVGALIPEKGVDTALRALAAVRSRWPAAMLTVVGVGAEQVALQKLASQLGVAGAVQWLGLRDDVPALFAAHDIALVPSRWAEAFGLTLAEAMAAGRAVLASRVGGIPEIIDDGRTGLLLPPGDPVPWAAAIDRLWQAPELRARLGRAARESVRERFTLERSVAQYWALYHRLAPEHFPMEDRA